MLRKWNRAIKSKKGQTALEYALVVGAISLVIMAAWNVVGSDVKETIQGVVRGRIMDNLQKGNATIRR